MSATLTRHLNSGRLAVALSEIAGEAAEVIRPFWRSGTKVLRKADNSPVTEADRLAERVISERLRAAYPGVQIIGEEGTEAAGLPERVERQFFLIDPLDGTASFSRDAETFTVNIALVREGEAVAGAIAAPATGQAWRGSGDRAEMQRVPGEPWRAIRTRTLPAEGGVALLSHAAGDVEAERLARRYGCTSWQAVHSSLKFCLMAEGRFDVYPRTGPTSEWDTAAGDAILRAAGGRVLTLDGEPLRYGKLDRALLNPGFVALGQ
ncbi:MAG: 3'(2'),5'-bisphosphate nucleotidase CysQ [Brevundimonas sp.]|uniref:3'(2'),5'-bisphosphate nucleotidase CysQ n=1 Tax=Brevundimonas sp. TaxID=1871086 RepID=UPI0039194356